MARSILLIFCFAGLWATKGPAQSMGTLYLSGSYHTVDIQTLNQALNTGSFAYPQFEEALYTWGFGLRIGGPRFRVGWNVNYLSQTQDEVEPMADAGLIEAGNLSATQVIFDLNYGLIQHRGRRLFVIAPTIGAGYERIALAFQLPDRDNTTFEEVVIKPGRGTQLQRYNLLLDVALQIDLAFKHEPEFDEAGRIFTIRAGYLFSPVGFKWREQQGNLGSRTLEDGPEFSLAGPYIRLAIGI